jgi:hypothetical protein
MNSKLPISVGLISWNSGEVLDKTLSSYQEMGLFDIVDDFTILFQEFSNNDYELVKKYKLNFIGLNNNIGIGRAFLRLTENAINDNVLLLEHDWNLIENLDVTHKRLSDGLSFLDKGFSCVRYRHRKKFGYPNFSLQYIGRETTYYDKKMECNSPHLLDSLHWLNPDEHFNDKIQKDGEYFITTSRWANWTNNPCLYKKDFYLKIVEPFVGKGIELEYNIGKWWSRQEYKVAQGEGLFKHNDWLKYGLYSNLTKENKNYLI